MSNDEKIIKHLEMIQGIINRLAHDSFLIKGWSMTILVAGMVFISKNDSNAEWMMLLFLIPIMGFWVLDGYFLWQERLFREVYNDVRKWEKTDFAMNIPRHVNKSNRSWPSAIFSRTLIIFYMIEITFVIGIFIVLKISCGGTP